MAQIPEGKNAMAEAAARQFAVARLEDGRTVRWERGRGWDDPDVQEAAEQAAPRHPTGGTVRGSLRDALAALQAAYPGARITDGLVVYWPEMLGAEPGTVRAMPDGPERKFDPEETARQFELWLSGI